jgi:hypothetical protein
LRGKKLLDRIAQGRDLERLIDPEVWNGFQKGVNLGGDCASTCG